MQSLDLKQDYFALFDLDLGFDIDLHQLHSAQQHLQSDFHPDRFVNASEQDKRLSVQQAAWINQAYETLSNPVKRARYLLTLKGVDMQDDSETTSDMKFLTEQITRREEMDACRSNPDPVNCCEQIAHKIDLKNQQYMAEFKTHFDQGELNAARISSRKMQFVQRISEQLAELQFDLEEELD